MFVNGFLHNVPTGIIVVVLVGAMAASMEIGRQIAERERTRFDGEARTHASNLHTAVLGLLALLLGFTFSMATTRFETVRGLVVDEASAIETAYRRADLAPEPERSIIKNRLTRYVDTNIDFYKAGIDEEARRAVADEVRGLQATIWRQAVSTAEQAPTTMSALLLEAVNEVADAHVKRLDARDHNVPAMIVWLLVVMAVASTGLTGYVAAFGNRQHPAPTAIVLVLIALVIGVIIELDRPTRGLIQGGQDSMLELRRDFREHIPVTGP
jgi:hypothetical protein